jgi:hypothetical protein
MFCCPCEEFVFDNIRGDSRTKATFFITPLHRYYEPIRNPLVFHRFPGFASYTGCCSADFSAAEEGFSSC